MLNSVEHEKSFIISVSGFQKNHSLALYIYFYFTYVSLRELNVVIPSSIFIKTVGPSYLYARLH